MTPILKLRFGIAILAISLALVSMSPDRDTTNRDEMKHLIKHGGQFLHLTKTAYDAHESHSGKVDCEPVGICLISGNHQH